MVKQETGSMALTPALAAAVQRAAVLPEAEQDFLAWLITQEMEDEQRWEASFARSQALLDQWAEEARAETNAGKTLLLDPDSM